MQILQSERNKAMTMSVTEAVESRRSVRGFLDRPVDGQALRRVLSKAARAPSGCNLQPWHFHVIGGEPMNELKAIMRQRIEEAPGGEPTEYDIVPKNLPPEYNERRVTLGEDLYCELGIARADKVGRGRWFARNLQFFGAPAGLFCSIDRRLGLPQWADLGMVLQTIMLLLREEGLHSCPQEAWSVYPQTVGKFLGLTPELMLFCGMAIGHEDPADAANRYTSTRVPLASYAKFIGI